MHPDIAECLTLANTELQVARQKIAAEIAGYPTPVAGCDAQFNHLLAQRRKVDAALAALAETADGPAPRQPE